MTKRHVKLECDRSVDAAHLTLRRAPVSSSEEVRPGVIVDLDEAGDTVGVEILRFSRRFANSAALRAPPRKRAAARR